MSETKKDERWVLKFIDGTFDKTSGGRAILYESSAAARKRADELSNRPIKLDLAAYKTAKDAEYAHLREQAERLLQSWAQPVLLTEKLEAEIEIQNNLNRVKTAQSKILSISNATKSRRSAYV